MHFHRDLLIIADAYAKNVLQVKPDDVFVGSPPIAFTFGLGGLAVFPLRFGAAAALIENATPPNLIEIIETYKATVCFTAPTAYRAMLAGDGRGRRSLLAAPRRVRGRDPAGAGVSRPGPSAPACRSSTASARPKCCMCSSRNRLDDAQPGSTGLPVPGYRGEGRRRGLQRSPARRRRPARGARADGLPLSRRRAAEGLCRRTAGTSPATPSCRTRTAISISPRATTT